MLSIRLSRVGKKHQPSYRLIVVDKRKDPWGNYLENLGIYNPLQKPKVVDFKAERVKHWISKGAKPTETVWNLLVDQKIVEGAKLKRHASSNKPAEQAASKAQETAKAAAAPAPAEAVKVAENKEKEETAETAKAPEVGTVDTAEKK